MVPPLLIRWSDLPRPFLPLAGSNRLHARPNGELKAVIPKHFQSVCPWNVKFSQELVDDSPFKARDLVAGKDAVTLATDTLALEQEQLSAVLRKSPIKRAKFAGLRRNAAVALKNLG